MNALIENNRDHGLKPGSAPKQSFHVTVALAPRPEPIAFRDERGCALEATAFAGICAGRDVVVIAPSRESTVKLRRILLDSVHVGFGARDLGTDGQGRPWLYAADEIARVGAGSGQSDEQRARNLAALGLAPAPGA